MAATNHAADKQDITTDHGEASASESTPLAAACAACLASASEGTAVSPSDLSEFRSAAGSALKENSTQQVHRQIIKQLVLTTSPHLSSDKVRCLNTSQLRGHTW